MIVIVVENAPPALRGRLALWLVEVRAGVYVGDYSERVREMLWHTVVAALRGDTTANAVITWAARTEAGYDLDFAGFNRREVIDHDGMKLVRFVSDDAAMERLFPGSPPHRPESDDA